MINAIRSKLPNAVVNVAELAMTRAMTKDTTFIVTDPELMRGFDYRSNDSKGISLFIAK